MPKPSSSSLIASVVLVMLALGASLLAWQPAPGLAARARLQEPGSLERAIYLPVMFANYQRGATVFGVESEQIAAAIPDKLDKTRTYWVRSQAIDWSRIEPVRTDPPTYDWSSIDEAGLIAAAEKQLTVIATVKFTPGWAQRYPGSRCGLPKKSAYEAYAQFMHALVKRYSPEPYKVRFWELGNEVEVDYRALQGDSGWGCYGDWEAPYYGAGEYTELLKHTTPSIRSADPRARVIAGSFLLGCSPDNPPPGLDCSSATFLEGILVNGGGPYFDFVSYHTYAYYDGNTNRIVEDSPRWSADGSANYTGKLEYLRRVLEKHGVSKQLMLTETALVCIGQNPGCSPVSPGFEDRQADYVYWVYLRGWAEKLKAVIWFGFEDLGWRASSLYAGQQPRPAYYAYQYLSHALSGAVLTGPVQAYPELSGYEFQSGNRRLWIVWSADQADHQIDLPPTTLQVLDKFGQPIALQGASLTINSPVTIEMLP